ncbi:hypothetical protein QTH09_12335 [Clostridium perfringens]|nr:hypothetical protein [Clostridium perfringens]
MQKLLLLIFDIFIFEECIGRVFSPIRYFDEILVIIMAICAIFTISFRRNRLKSLNNYDFKMILGLFVFLILGTISTFIFNKNFKLTIGMFKDILAVAKPFVNFIFFIIVFKNVNKDSLLNKTSKRCEIYISVIFIFCILNLFFNIGMDHGKRLGIKVFTFLYPHPTYLVFSIVIMLTILIASNKKNKNIYIFLGMLILLSTFRSKALIFVLAYILINIYYQYTEKFKLKYFIIIGIVGVILTWGKVEDYFIHGLYAARPALYIIAVKIMIDYFPFGTGFCSFGSSLSGKYYSSVYYKYQISNVAGLQVNNYAYMADSFWPYVLGQFGLSGLITYVIMLIELYKSLKTRYYGMRSKLKAIDILIFYLLFASTAEAIFIDVTGQFAFIILAVFLGDYYKKENLNNNERKK